MRTLRLKTPHLKGQDVADAQWLLSGHNVFKRNWHPGKIDREYGPSTVGAAVRAKRALGYPERLIVGTFGEKLYRYLHGDKKLPLAYRRRRKARLKKAAAVPRRVKALRVALTQRGVTEHPAGSNCEKYSRWADGRCESWCADFASWCYAQVGSKLRYSYVPSIVHDARRGRNGLSVVQLPEPGDLVCYDWERDGLADHVGLFESWVPREFGAFYAVEGNTAVGNDSNGGEVMLRQRSRRQVAAFVRVHN